MPKSKELAPQISANADLKINDFPRPVIQTGTTTRNDFSSTPLPHEWIISGNPVARSIPLARAEDGNLSCGLWDCQAGKFKFIFSTDEIVHILEGEVIIEEDGALHTLRTGDVAFFPEGRVSYWTVHNYVKKFAVFRSVEKPLSERIIRRLRKILRF